MLLLIVPGLVLYWRWYVALPVLVHEKLGPLESMSRSAFLTYGHRWRLLWIHLVVALPFLALVLALFAVTFAYLQSFSSINVAFTMISIVASVAVTIIVAVLGAVCYVGLRVIKEDIGVDELAQASS